MDQTAISQQTALLRGKSQATITNVELGSLELHDLHLNRRRLGIRHFLLLLLLD
jgi:hypothetical protein